MSSMFARLGMIVALLGAPLIANAMMLISSIDYPGAGGTRHFQVFGRSSDDHLVANSFDGASWSWTDHGVPPGASKIVAPEAITFNDGGTQYVHVFVATGSGRLFVRYWNGAVWQWSDQGGPDVDVTHAPSAITYVDSTGNRRIYVFVKSKGFFSSKLLVNY